jgi:dTDP-4-dehydrorhamnose reductase
MKILIIGANGQLGQDFVGLFEERGIKYMALSHEDLDITDFKRVKEAIEAVKPGVIINCAAYNQVDKAEKEWMRAYLVNGVGARNLALASEKFNSAIVHYSTDYVFDGKKSEPYTILDTPNPVNKYGESKLLGERYIKDLCKLYFLIRVSWLFGGGGTNFPRKVIKWASQSNSLKIVTDEVSSPSYTKDVAKATLDLIKEEAFGTYHITNDGHCSRYGWAKYILDRIKWQGEVVPVDRSSFSTLAKRPQFSALNNFPFKETVGYGLPHWKDATDRFLRAMRNDE